MALMGDLRMLLVTRGAFGQVSLVDCSNSFIGNSKKSI
jgi:hypothetical protein